MSPERPKPFAQVAPRDSQPGNQFEAWRQHSRPIVEFSAAEASPSRGDAAVTSWRLGSMLLCTMITPRDAAPGAWRPPGNPAGDHWCLSLEVDRVDGAAGSARKRSLTFRSMSRSPDDLGRTGQIAGLILPRDLFPETATLFDSIDEHIPDSGLGSLLADYMLAMVRNIGSVNPADMPLLIAATKSMVTFCLTPKANGCVLARGAASLSVFERACGIIRQDLPSATLDATRLCRQLGVSRSRLYRLFEGVGGVNAYIRRQRLLAARRALCDPQDLRPIGVIATAVGFVDASGFSRAFHREFGTSPSSVRMSALTDRVAAMPLRA